MHPLKSAGCPPSLHRAEIRIDTDMNIYQGSERPVCCCHVAPRHRNGPAQLLSCTRRKCCVYFWLISQCVSFASKGRACLIEKRGNQRHPVSRSLWVGEMLALTIELSPQRASCRSGPGQKRRWPKQGLPRAVCLNPYGVALCPERLITSELC